MWTEIAALNRVGINNVSVSSIASSQLHDRQRKSLYSGILDEGKDYCKL